ncbi:glycosyltransferase family 2 protein [Cupriavidus oxalaticus]|uniref:glycosyltransferase family 2 protein n=1 Tax=Cupriavidus oxalaticus TaxID=96344 RepID=UPI003171C0D2
MLNRLLSLWHLRKRRFAYALAHMNVEGKRANGWRLWSYYRLGMYASVISHEPADHSWQGIFAQAVSFAACGHRKKAEECGRVLLRRDDCAAQLPALAAAMAPYLPEFALELLESDVNAWSLKAALLLRTNRSEAAQRLLTSALAEGRQGQYPELHLHMSNALAEEPAKRLSRLNAYLGTFNVPSLVLRNVDKPPAPGNLKAAEPLAHVDGPLVTVLMTTFETGDRAAVAIASVLKQSYQNLELIVIDDASRDGTSEIVQSWARRDNRVKFIQLERNGGTYLAKNIGLSRAKGTFVTCHDSDDWSHPSKIERQVKPLLEDERLVATTSNWIRLQDDGVFFSRQVHPLARINPSSPLFRRDKVHQKAGMWDNVRTGADSEFLARLRLAFGSAAVHRVRQPLAFGSHREGSLMTAEATGYSDSGISPQRLAYWEAWSHWHIATLRTGRQPQLTADILSGARARPFPAPDSIVLKECDVKAGLEGARLYGDELAHPIAGW